MTERSTKSVKVTFDQSLPMGTRGVFIVDKEQWIAYPQKKNQMIWAVTDRMAGAHKAMIRDLIAMVNDHPEDVVRVTAILERATAALALHDDLINDKVRAHVS